ncbi:MAG: hypothetical protein VB140_01490 [Burkholderia sp.]
MFDIDLQFPDHKLRINICKCHTREGTAGLRDKPRGGAMNQSRDLSEQQEVEIRMLLHDQMPDQTKMSFALWTDATYRAGVDSEAM